MRLFAAVEPPPLIKSALEGIQSGVPGARWTFAENMHLTLKFFGEVDSDEAEELGYELQRIDMPSFELSLSGAGQFSGGNGLRSLWMGMKPSEPLIDLQTQVDRAARRSGVTPERRNFKPHITLARFSYPPDLHRAKRFLERYARFDRPSFRVSGFSVYSSDLRPKGAIYTTEADFPFSDAGIGDTPFFGDWEKAAQAKPIRTK